MSLRKEFENEIKNTKGGISILFETRNQQYIEWLENKLTNLRQDNVPQLPSLEEGDVLEYTCLGHPNDWYEVPQGITDMKYFEPTKMRIKKPNGDIETITFNIMTEFSNE